jgi:hypothetical protein
LLAVGRSLRARDDRSAHNATCIQSNGHLNAVASQDNARTEVRTAYVAGPSVAYLSMASGWVPALGCWRLGHRADAQPEKFIAS